MLKTKQLPSVKGSSTFHDCRLQARSERPEGVLASETIVKFDAARRAISQAAGAALPNHNCAIKDADVSAACADCMNIFLADFVNG